MPALRSNHKHMLWAGSVITALLLIFATLVQPTLERINTLERLIPQKQQTLLQVEAAAGRYARLTHNAGGPEAGSGMQSIEMLSSFENLARDQGLGSRMTATKRDQLPVGGNLNQSIVEVRLTDVTATEAFRFLKSVAEAGNNVRIRKFYLTRNRSGQKGLDASVEIQSGA